MDRYLMRFTATFCAIVLTFSASLRANQPSTQPLTEPMKKAVLWLVNHQMNDGAWGQGEESEQMGHGLDNIKSTANVADTCMALMALYRAGSTPREGPYKFNSLAAVNFICDQIEKANDESLSITSLTGTRTQLKLGTHIDTFFAAHALSELKGQMPDATSTNRVELALARVIHKIEVNQNRNGQWADTGWAPTLAQAEASKALNIAVQNGVKVDDTVRARAEEYARADFRNNGFGGGGGARGGDNAGVELYSAGSQIAAMQSSANTNDEMKQSLGAIVASPTTAPAARDAAVAELKRFDENAKDLADAQKDVIDRMNDPQFINGFGSNGGEEFLSDLNIGESLFIKGGETWQSWDKGITENLNRIQNDDGSWSGQHCITGRTFCTSAALMVLTIDRSPLPTTQNTEKN